MNSSNPTVSLWPFGPMHDPEQGRIGATMDRKKRAKWRVTASATSLVWTLGST